MLSRLLSRLLSHDELNSQVLFLTAGFSGKKTSQKSRTISLFHVSKNTQNPQIALDIMRNDITCKKVGLKQREV